MASIEHVLLLRNGTGSEMCAKILYQLKRTGCNTSLILDAGPIDAKVCYPDGPVYLSM